MSLHYNSGTLHWYVCAGGPALAPASILMQADGVCLAKTECRQWYLILGQVPIGTILNFLVPFGTLIFLKVLIFPKSIKTMHQKILFQVLKSPMQLKM